MTREQLEALIWSFALTIRKEGSLSFCEDPEVFAQDVLDAVRERYFEEEESE